MRRPALLAACLAAVVTLAACGSPKSTASTPSSTSLPGSPQAASGGAPAPSTPAASLPPACGLSDSWGIAYLKATQSPVPAAQQAEITASLDKTAAALVAAVPEVATAVNSRTELAKKVMAGTATDAERQAEAASRDAMNAWYAGACAK